jgi:hemolysin activation/secretion protein
MCRLIALATIALSLALTSKANAQSTPELLAPYVLGSSVYSVRELAPEIAAVIGMPATVTSLDALRAAITARYARDGYISPLIDIPTEDLGSPTPRVYIHEARIDTSVIKGDPGPYRARIEVELRALQAGALRKQSLRKALLGIRRLPGITATPLFEPQPEEPNVFRLIVNIAYESVGAEMDANNGGTHDLGRVIYAGALSLNGLLGAGEQLQFRAASSAHPDRYKYVDVKATRWLGAATEGSVEGGTTAAAPDPETNFSAREVTLGLRHLLLANGGTSLALLGTLHGNDSLLRDANNAHLVEDRIRTLALGVQLEHFGTLAQTSTYLTIDRAANVFGATSLDARDSEVNPAFTKYVFDVVESVSLNPLWKARLDLYAQLTRDVLPIVERYAFGGLGFGEAFDPASLVGDSGTTVTAEIGRALTPRLARIRYATLFARADYGIAWNNATYLPRKDDAASLSIGMLGKWTHFTGIFSLSTPVHQPEYTQPASSLRVLLSGALSF